MEKQNIQRHVAYKASVKKIIDAKYVKEEGWNPNYLLLGNKQVSRVNIIAIVVEKEENEGNLRMLVDDGSGSIPLISFEKFIGWDKAKIGDCVLIIGRPRIYNEETYIMPEIVRQTDRKWIEVRKKELEKQPEEASNAEHKTVDETGDDMTPAEKVMEKIKELDKGEGVGTDKLTDVENIDHIIVSLLERGEIFEISPGKYKLLD